METLAKPNSRVFVDSVLRVDDTVVFNASARGADAAQACLPLLATFSLKQRKSLLGIK